MNNAIKGFTTQRRREENTWPYLTIRTISRLVVYDWEAEKKIFLSSLLSSELPPGSLPYSYLLPGKTARGNYAYAYAQKLFQLREVKRSAANLSKGMLNIGLFFTIIVCFLFNTFISYILYRRKTVTGSTGEDKGIEAYRFTERLQGIAKDLKNPITTILWTTEKLKQDPQIGRRETHKDTESYQRMTELLCNDAQILKEKTGSLLELIRGQTNSTSQKKDGETEK